jgi:hypothetical protein
MYTELVTPVPEGSRQNRYNSRQVSQANSDSSFNSDQCVSPMCLSVLQRAPVQLTSGHAPATANSEYSQALLPN